MAWKLLYDVVENLDVVKESLALGKAAGGAAAGYVANRVWRWIVGEKPTELARCKIKKCQGQGSQQYRGLCLKCYAAAKKLVDRGDTTWDQLAAKGLCDEKVTGCPFDDAYSQIMKDE